MPHNLYLHSSICRRPIERDSGRKAQAIKFATTIRLGLDVALSHHAAILIPAPAVFHWSGTADVADIQGAYKLLSPLLGVGVAGVILPWPCSLPGKTRPSPDAWPTDRHGVFSYPADPLASPAGDPGPCHRPAVGIMVTMAKADPALAGRQSVVLSMQLRFRHLAALRFTDNKAKMGRVCQCALAQKSSAGRPLLSSLCSTSGCFHHRGADAVQKPVFQFLAWPYQFPDGGKHFMYKKILIHPGK